MVARTAKIMGSAYSTQSTITIEVEYNGNIVYSGTMPAITQNPTPITQPNTNPNWESELGTFVTDTDITGQIPCRITVTNGTLFFGHFWMNYTGNVIYTPNSNPPPEYITTPVAPIELFSDPNINTVESDGLSNTRKNGVEWPWRSSPGDMLGDWCYPVYSGETFTFDFFVDPDCVVLTPYVPPSNP
jgi:hypothetical protein